ncbi:MAG TPA: hypothetical protein VFV94_17180, partial [Polyangiaceae bacterium]|nr:hypothetical protein [Polyangiaceae bacterium]
MLRSAVFAFVSALPVLGCAAARPRMAPVAPADAAYATPRLAHPLPAGAHYERSSELDVEDSALRSGGVAVDEVFRDDCPTRLLGIVDDAIFFRRGRALFRHRLPDGKDEQLTGDTEPLAAVAVDGDEAFYATLDCDVFSTKQYRLGGECPGS